METPQFLGPYRLGESLGRGGMGSVFRGTHERTGDLVAVKLIAEHVADEMRFRRRFDAEIETLKRLQHEGIVRLIGYGEQKGQLFYSMELVEGEPLQKRIRSVKRLGHMATIDIAVQICAALKHAHDLGVIHRDLKPANLILTKDDRVKLVDFGIAKLFGFGEQTAAGSVLGTADYMAPEQASNDGITARTDLYALGSVMYAMLAGRPPFKGKKITDVIESLIREKPVPLELINPDLPGALVELVHELLNKDPKDRPPTALAAMNRLKAMRVGLLHEQTLHEEREATRENKPSKPAAGLTIEQSTSVKKPPMDLSAATVHHIDITRVEAPIGSDHATNMPADEPVVSEAPQSTHFQTVDESEAGQSGIFGNQEPESSSSIARVLSIGTMIGILAIGAFLVLYSVRQPAAGELYNEIIAVTDTGELTDARPLISRFLKLYPEHERFDEVNDMQRSLDLDVIIRRLDLKSKVPNQLLEAHEDAFLDAMRIRSEDTTAAQDKLQQWLNVFATSAEQVSGDRKEMLVLVNHEMARLARDGRKIGDNPATRDLLQRIRAGAELAATERRDLLEGIIELYRDKPWAKPAIEMAQRELESLE